MLTIHSNDVTGGPLYSKLAHVQLFVRLYINIDASIHNILGKPYFGVALILLKVPGGRPGSRRQPGSRLLLRNRIWVYTLTGSEERQVDASAIVGLLGTTGPSSEPTSGWQANLSLVLCLFGCFSCGYLLVYLLIRSR